MVNINTAPLPLTMTSLGGFTILVGLYSLIIKEKLYLSESLVATVFGVLMGPKVLNVVDPKKWGSSREDSHSSVFAMQQDSTAVLVGMNSIEPIYEPGKDVVGGDGIFGNIYLTLQFARIVIAIQVMAAGIQLPKRYLLLHWKSLCVLLGPVMVYSWLFTGAAIYLILGLPWLKALMIAGCIAPTDPILANSICKGRFADKHVPVHVRYLLSAESGVNDGTAYPFILLAFSLLKYPVGKALTYWILDVILYEICVGIILGIVVGYCASWLLKKSEEKGWIDKESFLSFAIALALFTDGLSSVLGMDDLLSVFVAGVTLSWDDWFSTETAEAHIQEVIDNIVNLAFFIYFGTIIPWDSYYAGSPSETLSLWRLVVLAIVVLIGKRLPIVLLLYKVTPSFITVKEAGFAGFFGPIGVGAIFFACLIQILMLPTDIYTIPIVLFLVLASVIVHGSCISFFRLSVGLVRTISGGSRTASGRPIIMRAPRRPDVQGELVISGPVRAVKMWNNSDTVRSFASASNVRTSFDVMRFAAGNPSSGEGREVEIDMELNGLNVQRMEKNLTEDLDKESGSAEDGGLTVRFVDSNLVQRHPNGDADAGGSNDNLVEHSQDGESN
ncbi:Sodium/hydrogen exchanger family-domain-containing protein [Paraphysoderma sedebokerense]|nr:Sodium/hydrogen exchanger family-domain-containing protein [Paraphysoderma sedebokerense]